MLGEISYKVGNWILHEQQQIKYLENGGNQNFNLYNK